MAIFVIAMGLSPTEYKNLTVLERDELIKVHKQKVKAQGG